MYQDDAKTVERLSLLLRECRILHITNTAKSFVQIDVNIPTIISYIVIKLRKLWRRMIGEPEICYYCGQPADSIDHVVPQSALLKLSAMEDMETTNAILKKRILQVPACRECNCLLGNSMQDTLAERKAFLKRRIRKRYAKLLNMPQWTEDETEELGRNLSDYIKSSIEKKKLIKFRLAW